LTADPAENDSSKKSTGAGPNPPATGNVGFEPVEEVMEEDNTPDVQTVEAAARKAQIEEFLDRDVHPEKNTPSEPSKSQDSGPYRPETEGADGEDGIDESGDAPPPEEVEEAGLGIDLPVIRKSDPGADAGIDAKQLADLPSIAGSCVITCIDYGSAQCDARTIDDFEDFIIQHRPDWATVRWINVDGLTDMKIIQALAEKYELHPLALEDLLHIPQRPKLDVYPGTDTRKSRVFLIARMIQLDEYDEIHSKQVSIFLGHSTVLTFQEDLRGDVWGPIRERLRRQGSKLRVNDASFLVYALLDALVDHCFPLLEDLGERIEELDKQIFTEADHAHARAVHQINQDLMLLRRQIVPMRDMVVQFQRTPHDCIGANTQLYLRDVTDHLIQIIDLIDTYREVTEGMTAMIMNQINIRMNESIKVLAVVGTIFTPITFLASVYGMNFKHLPELETQYGYVIFWIVCIVSSVAMWFWFKWKKWL
jgi:magnesium transporter